MTAPEPGDSLRGPSRPYPIVLTGLGGARCVVVGGGAVAERKVAGLLECGARVTVISPTLSQRLDHWMREGALEYIGRRFRADDLFPNGEKPLLVFAASDDATANAEVAREARALGILANVADDPHAGAFNTVAAVRRHDLLLTVSTGGASPALSALVRRKLEATIGPEYGELLTLLGELRRGAARALAPQSRTRLWRKLASEEVLAWLAAGQRERVHTFAQALVRQAQVNGQVDMPGAGEPSYGDSALSGQ